MQKVTREQLIAKASELLANGTVSCVLGWSEGEFGYDVTPSLFNKYINNYSNLCITTLLLSPLIITHQGNLHYN